MHAKYLATNLTVAGSMGSYSPGASSVWRFDRAGACGSTIIDIHKEPVLFLRAMESYFTMDAAQIGFDPSIRWSPQGTEQVFDPTAYYVADNPPYPFIYVPVSLEDTTANPPKTHPPNSPPPAAAFPSTGWTALSVDPASLLSRFAVATRGSVCWQARLRDTPQDSLWPFVVKDQ